MKYKNKMILLTILIAITGKNTSGAIIYGNGQKVIIDSISADGTAKGKYEKDDVVTSSFSKKFAETDKQFVSLKAGEIGIFEDTVDFTVDKGKYIGTDKIINLGSGNSEFINKGNLSLVGKINGVDMQGGTFTNSGTMSIDGTGTLVKATGDINQILNTGTLNVENGGVAIDANKSGNVINEGTINVGSNSTGIMIANKAVGINNGKIAVSGDNSVGMYAKEGGTVINSGEIQVAGKLYTAGMKAYGLNSTAINEGIIILNGDKQTSNAMIAQNGGSIENKNEIQVSETNASAMAADGKNSNLLNNGKIIVKDGSKGFKLTDTATGENNGIIIVDGTNANGIYTESQGVGINKNSILVSGDSSNGMYAYGGTVINDGEINVTATSFTTGMKAYGSNSTAINNNLIMHKGNGQTSNAILSQNGAYAENNGIIEVSGVNVSGMSAAADSKVANEKDGTINIYDKAMGFKIETKGTGENKGTINNYSTNFGIYGRKDSTIINSGEVNNYSSGFGMKIEETVGTNKGTINNLGSGAGVLVTNGTFVNEGGTINSENGIAIKSEILRKKDPNGKYYDAPTNNNVVLKGGQVKGSIQGGIGIDALYLEGENNISGTNIENYEIISATGGNSKIDNSYIDLEYNSGTKKHFETGKNDLATKGIISQENGILTVSNSSMVVDFKNSLTDTNLESSIISANKIVFDGNMNFSFISGDGREEFNLKEAFGGVDIELGENANIASTVVWDYDISDNNIVARKKKYGEILTTNKLSEFVKLVENDRVAKSLAETRSTDKSLTQAISDAEQLSNAGQFTSAMGQLSGGVYGYTVDIAAINARTLSGMMYDRVKERDFTRTRPTNSGIQDVLYIDNNHKIKGLMDVNYDERGILGITEKQVEPNATIGLIYGGSNGDVKFDGGKSGTASLDNIYFGGYYNFDFTERFSLLSNVRVNYSFNSVKRVVDYGNTYANFDSTFPTYGLGLGTRAIYSVGYEGYKFGAYAGLDWTKIVQGNVAEDPRPTSKPQNELAVNNNPVDEEFYDSVVPTVGLTVEKAGYVFGKKYRFGGGIGYETELGNIKDGKLIKLQGLSKEHRVGTTNMENIMSYNAFGALNLTEDLSLTANYTALKSSEYDANKLTVGTEYKFNGLSTGVLGPVFTTFDNMSTSKSDRWRGTATLMLETEENSDRVYFDKNGNIYSGDYATSTQYIPKLIVTLNDLKSKWSYYFEGYYRDNEMFQGLKSGEAEQHATRLHLEARWADSFSKGKYGINIGYRNETSEKPINNGKDTFREVKRGIHQLRLAPNFIYNIGNGFSLAGNFTNIAEYNYIGDREGQMDFIMENQVGVSYSGLLPRSIFRLNYYREDRWQDHDNTAERYQLNQLRPAMLYFFGNGGNIVLEGRVPLGNGGYSNATRTKTIASETYETRYGFTYTQPIATGLNGIVGVTLLTNKVKNKSTGAVTRNHSFRPKVGFSYSF